MRLSRWISFGCVALLGACQLSDSITRRALAAEPATASSSNTVNRFASPAEFERLCQLVRERNSEIDARSKAGAHLETSTHQEFDKKNVATLHDQVIERVRFPGGVEHRLLTKKVNLLTNQVVTPASVREEKRPPATIEFPLTKNESAGAYQYKLVGMESVTGRDLVKIQFEPAAPLDNKFRGHVWVDPATGEPVHFVGAWAKLPAFVHEMTMSLEWGPAENGHTQCRRSVVAGSGGVAFIFKRYRIETALSDYQPAP